MQFKSILAGFMVLFQLNAYSQGFTCAESDPFCTGTIYNFPAGTTGAAEVGPYYNCLYTQPAPAWYHMKIGNPGSITIYMYSTPLVDIDFICWGPFTDPFAPCPYGLTSSTVVDCSYSANPTEYCDIPNGQTGQYYILLITNYSQDPCNITFSQTAGSGSTDCSILPPLVSSDSPLCVGDSLHLYAETISNASYAWSGPNGFTSTLQNPVIPNVSLVNAGDYSCIITVYSQSSPPAITNVIINSLPDAALLNNDTTVCPGALAFMLVQLTGAGPFEVIYYNGSNYFNASGLIGPVDTIFVNPPGPATYTLEQVSDTNCTRILTGNSFQIYNYNLATGYMTGNATICQGDTAQLVFYLTGSPPWTITYLINGSNPQTVTAGSTPFIIPVTPQVTTQYQFTQLSDAYCIGTASGLALVTVNFPSGVLSGDNTICAGGTAQLNFVLTGFPPWTITYTANGTDEQTVIATYSPFSVAVNPLVSTLYEFTQLEDVFCPGTANGQAMITVHLPTGELSGSTTLCAGGTAQLSFILTGLPPWTITYTANGVDAQTVIATYSPFFVGVSPLVNTLYEFTILEDAFCTGTTSGQAMITIQQPNGELSGSAFICTGESVPITFNLTGIAPWNITYTANGQNPQTVIATYSPFSVTVNPLVNTLYEFTQLEDAFCVGTVNGEALITIHQPAGELSGSATVCSGESAQITFILTGTPPWSITYTENGGNPQTVIATDSPYSLAVNPLVSTLYEFTLLEDESCSGTVSGEAMITVHHPAGELSGLATGCAGDPAQITFNLTGTPPWSITYTENGGNPQTVIATYSPFNVEVNPLVNTLYEFTQLEDVFCSGTANGQAMVTIYQPAGELSGLATICAGESAQITFNLTGTPPWDITYTENGGNPQTILTYSTPYNLSVTPLISTIYSFTYFEDNSCPGLASGEALITVNPDPYVSAGIDKSIPNGTSTMLEGEVTGGSGSYTYQWQPAEKLVNALVLKPMTINLSSSCLFSLTATDHNGGCFGVDEVLITITGGMLSCYLFANPTVICPGETSQLQAIPSGGSGNYSYLWHSDPPGFSSDIQNPVVSPSQSSNYYVTVNDGYNVAQANVTVMVNELPLPNAGTDQVITFGTPTVLQGSASSGSGMYNYHWQPEFKLVNPYVPQPTTVNLYETTLFTLSVTDEQTGCVCSQTDAVAVIISGSALNVNPMAQSNTICSGDSTRLFSLSGGGTGIYNYSWTSDPPGFTSSGSDPIVKPLTSTIYTVSVSDGFNTAAGSVGVTVNPKPVVDLGNDTIVCVYDTITIDAGNQGASYIWSDGSTARTISVGSTGIGFESKILTVTVTSPEGCITTSKRSVTFDFVACTGIGDSFSEAGLRIYPNPGNGILLIENTGKNEIFLLSVTDWLGRNIISARNIMFSESNRQFVLDLKSYSEGIYLIRIEGPRLRPVLMKYILIK